MIHQPSALGGEVGVLSWKEGNWEDEEAGTFVGDTVEPR